MDLKQLKALVHEGSKAIKEFRQTARKTYTYTRTKYVDPKYNAWRDSDEGKAWKQEKLTECNYRCLECNKTRLNRCFRELAKQGA